jgi:2-polyprenyl-6-methoxyphenol hydroxylase-like FAD-dependent oxidoreductase
MDISVLIAGGGPIGLTLAADLSWRGVRSLLVEPKIAPDTHPRAISIGVRSMEHFRRLGLDQNVIDAGVPRSHPLDVVYVTRMLGDEVFRFRIPSVDDVEKRAKELAARVPEIAASPYYKTWTAQSPLEDVLRSHLEKSPHSKLRLGWRLDRFTEDANGVRADLLEVGTDRTETMSARYLVGCDGGASTVRAGLGIKLIGKGTLGLALGIYFRAPALRAMLRNDPAVMYWILAPGCAGVIYTIHGGDTWVFNRYYQAHEHIVETDPAGLLRSAFGADLDIEIISVQSWEPRQLVAACYGTERVFLAGDACHLFVPTGGFGMNTGIGDAVDLAWKLAAVLDGWGGPRLMASYDCERRPVGLSNTLEAADNYASSRNIVADLENIEAPGRLGEQARKAVAARLPPKLKHFAPIGVHLGYRYEGSPIIIPDGTPVPPRETASYAPTSRPGHRAPHLWLADGVSMLDLFGRGFTLLSFGAPQTDRDVFANAARSLNLPLTIEEIANPDAAELYQRRLVLVRPDGHVAWRGDAPPENVRQILDRVRGA